MKLIHKDSGQPTKLRLKKRSGECRSQTAADTSEQILQLLGDKELLSLDRRRSQGYNGTSIISVIYGGVQKCFLDQKSLAQYVHCATHDLNQVLNDAASAVCEVEACFTTMQELYVFLGTTFEGICYRRSSHLTD